jgi:hypothetical protein
LAVVAKILILFSIFHLWQAVLSHTEHSIQSLLVITNSTMIFQQALLVALLGLCASSADAFMISNPSVSSLSSSRTSSQSFFQPTCLREKEEEAGAEEENVTAAAPVADSGTDILNSAAFLTRKADVLKSDIEKMDESIAEVKATLEAGKEEWGGQIGDLQKEVRT